MHGSFQEDTFLILLLDVSLTGESSSKIGESPEFRLYPLPSKNQSTNDIGGLARKSP